MSEKASWNLAYGEEIVPGLRARSSLGGGELCEVYLAWDERLQCVVICKLLRPDRVGDDGALLDLEREAAIIARLAHPAIVRGFGAVLEGHRPHAVYEYCPGPNLRQRMRRPGPVSFEKIVTLAVQLCGALHYLAGAGVVHLDIKPSNVITGATARLIDFSVSRTVQRAHRIKRQIGTSNYMAPEQCAPGVRGEIGCAADIWGLGVTLFEAINGRLPFPKGSGNTGDSLEARYPQLIGEPRVFASTAPVALVDTVSWCLAKNPAARPTASQVISALGSLRADISHGAARSAPATAPRQTAAVPAPNHDSSICPVQPAMRE